MAAFCQKTWTHLSYYQDRLEPPAWETHTAAAHTWAPEQRLPKSGVSMHSPWATEGLPSGCLEDEPGGARFWGNKLQIPKQQFAGATGFFNSFTLPWLNTQQISYDSTWLAWCSLKTGRFNFEIWSLFLLSYILRWLLKMLQCIFWGISEELLKYLLPNMNVSPDCEYWWEVMGVVHWKGLQVTYMRCVYRIKIELNMRKWKH